LCQSNLLYHSFLKIGSSYCLPVCLFPPTRTGIILIAWQVTGNLDEMYPWESETFKISIFDSNFIINSGDLRKLSCSVTDMFCMKTFCLRDVLTRKVFLRRRFVCAPTKLSLQIVGSFYKRQIIPSTINE
jgi:hypothetical protein